MKEHIMLLGAEGFSEVSQEVWIREATRIERERFRELHPQIPHGDNTGRPYWTVVIDLEAAPHEIAEKASRILRTVRLGE